MPNEVPQCPIESVDNALKLLRAPGLRLALNAAAPQQRLPASTDASTADALTAAAKGIGDQLG